MRKVALIHDWLTGMRGGEKVLEVLCELFPTADIYTLVHLPGKVSPTIESHRIITSPLQAIPQIGRWYRHLLPMMPWAIEQFDFSDYDVLISTSHCVAKGAIPRPGAVHWSYCHTPMRYVWDQYDQYFGPGRASPLVRVAMKMLRPRLQRWDVRSAERVHHFLANSAHVQERIQRIYHRSSQVLYPPADVDFFSAAPDQPKPREDFFLIVSALAPYKRLDLALQACKKMGRRLVIIGEGQESATLRRLGGDQTEFLGWCSPETMRDYFQRARALLFPGEEDFGIVPVEAQAAGCPVIAFRKGGALETVVDRKTGVFFPEQTVESLEFALRQSDTQSWDPALMKQNASRFSRHACQEAFRRILTTADILPIDSRFS